MGKFLVSLCSFFVISLLLVGCGNEAALDNSFVGDYLQIEGEEQFMTDLDSIRDSSSSGKDEVDTNLSNYSLSSPIYLTNEMLEQSTTLTLSPKNGTELMPFLNVDLFVSDNYGNPGEIGEFAISGNLMFYKVTYSHYMAGSAHKTEIFMLEIDTGITQRLFAFDNISELIWVGNLRANSSSLFWVEQIARNDNVSSVVQTMDITSRELKKIREIESSAITFISASDRFVSWYESVDGSNQLVIYDLVNKQFIDTRMIDIANSALRPTVNGNSITYLTKVNGNYAINRHNFDSNEMQLVVLPHQMRVWFTDAGERFFVWTERQFAQINNNKIFVFDSETNELFIIEIDGGNVFTLLYESGYILLNVISEMSSSIMIIELSSFSVFEFNPICVDFDSRCIRLQNFQIAYNGNLLASGSKNSATNFFILYIREG